jgi:hypothetical protein
MITEGIHYGNQAGKTERKLWNRKYLQPRFSQIAVGVTNKLKTLEDKDGSSL